MITIKSRWNSDLVIATFDLDSLTDANLYGANLTDANLTHADLTDANLYGANLYGANLTHANLTGANLTHANLTGADLYGANLYGANLTRANLTRANLTHANLTHANLTGADLYGANLYGANLTRANLTGANLTGAKLPVFQIVPEEGAFVAWKKVRASHYDDVILKLLIPEDARRISTPTSRKCRADKVLVLAAMDTDLTKFHSHKDYSFIYRVGETASVSEFDDDIRNVCTAGLHFFLTRKEAEEYEF